MSINLDNILFYSAPTQQSEARATEKSRVISSYPPTQRDATLLSSDATLISTNEIKNDDDDKLVLSSWLRPEATINDAGASKDMTNNPLPPVALSSGVQPASLSSMPSGAITAAMPTLSSTSPDDDNTTHPAFHRILPNSVLDVGFNSLNGEKDSFCTRQQQPSQKTHAVNDGFMGWLQRHQTTPAKSTNIEEISESLARTAENTCSASVEPGPPPSTLTTLPGQDTHCHPQSSTRQPTPGQTVYDPMPNASAGSTDQTPVGAPEPRSRATPRRSKLWSPSAGQTETAPDTNAQSLPPAPLPPIGRQTRKRQLPIGAYAEADSDTEPNNEDASEQDDKELFSKGCHQQSSQSTADIIYTINWDSKKVKPDLKANRGQWNPDRRTTTTMSFPTESKLEIFAEEANLYKATLETSLEQSSPPSSWYDAAAALDTWAVEYDDVLTNIPETMHNDIAEDNERSGSGDTGKTCVDNGSANNDSDSSYNHDTESENCTQELAVPGSELTVQDSSGVIASHIHSKSNSAVPDSTRSPSCATSPTPSSPIDVSVALLDSVEEPQPDVSALPTPSSDHNSVSQEGGDAITSRKKRGRGAIECSCESRDPRLPKRRRSQDANIGTVSPTLPARTLRTLPSPFLKDRPDKTGLTTQGDRQLRRSSRSQARSHTAISMNCDNDHPHLDGLPALDLDHALRTGERAGKRRGRSPTTPEVTSPHSNHSSGELGPQRSGRVPLPPVATTAEPSAATCHTCGFSAEHLLRMSDTVQALIGSGAECLIVKGDLYTSAVP
ncbi:hypothetical protein CSOJ01_15448 [Colletotrichum sojae]|uniref:Uncharacterized protein n=1 Tax=Colletotrichum sojae TaxID=2175907 RepID=A0A8H6IMH9_9PEZI|nr:hypothetical protein CSOJ01_15448 [Colletotrichum sojae]